MKIIDILFPDIGNANKISVSDIYVNIGDHVKINDSLIMVQTDKSSVEIPSTVCGIISEIIVKSGDKIIQGDLILRIESLNNKEIDDDNIQLNADTVIIGSGPGGYTAAFRAADLGLSVILIERFDSLGGVCLNVGCIPSKTLLHVAKVVSDAKDVEIFGIEYPKPKINIKKVNQYKKKVIDKLTNGLSNLANQRKIKIINGYASFINTNLLKIIDSNNNIFKIKFNNVIIATGSRPNIIPNVPNDIRVVDSTGILELNDIPKNLLIIGAGIIGLEMAEVYSTLGSEVVIVELSEGILPGVDLDIVKVLQQKIKSKPVSIYTKTKCINFTCLQDGIYVQFDTIEKKMRFDKILVATGRTPNIDNIDIQNTGVTIDKNGFIIIDKNCRTNIANIFAIGDVVGHPMLAHKATHQGKVAAENCALKNSFYDKKIIPFVCYTDPEVAWVGLSEQQAKKQNIAINVGKFPWSALGRAIGSGRDEGFTKIISDKETDMILGASIIGINAGELISEITLAIEMGCTTEDISLTIHPHPTLSESIGLGCEMIDGTITDLFIKHKLEA